MRDNLDATPAMGKTSLVCLLSIIPSRPNLVQSALPSIIEDPSLRNPLGWAGWACILGWQKAGLAGFGLRGWEEYVPDWATKPFTSCCNWLRAACKLFTSCRNALRSALALFCVSYYWLCRLTSG